MSLCVHAGCWIAVVKSVLCILNFQDPARKRGVQQDPRVKIWPCAHLISRISIARYNCMLIQWITD